MNTTLTGSVNPKGTLHGGVSSEGTLHGGVSSEGTLGGVVSAQGTLTATMTQKHSLNATVKPAERLTGSMSKPQIYNPLPYVTVDDDGKVLKVKDGQWDIGLDDTAEPLSNLEIEALINNSI